MKHSHYLLLLWCPVLIPLDDNLLGFPFLLFQQPVKPFVCSFGPLSKSGLIPLVPSGLVHSIEVILEESTSCSEGIPFSPIFPSFLWPSGCLTLLFVIGIRKSFDELLSDRLEAE